MSAMTIWRKFRRLFAPSVRVNEWRRGQFVAVYLNDGAGVKLVKLAVESVTKSGRALVNGRYYTAAGNCIENTGLKIFPWTAKHQRALNRAEARRRRMFA